MVWTTLTYPLPSPNLIALELDGTYGSWYTSGPGNGINVISVASVDNLVIPIQNVTVKSVDHDPIVSVVLNNLGTRRTYMIVALP